MNDDREDWATKKAKEIVANATRYELPATGTNPTNWPRIAAAPFVSKFWLGEGPVPDGFEHDVLTAIDAAVTEVTDQYGLLLCVVDIASPDEACPLPDLMGPVRLT